MEVSRGGMRSRPLKAFTVASAMLLAVGTSPATAQQVVKRFPENISAQVELLEEDSLRVDLALAETGLGVQISGALAGGILGAGLAGTIAYFAHPSRTLSCDDGLCPWMGSVAVWSGVGFLAGGALGWRISSRGLKPNGR